MKIVVCISFHSVNIDKVLETENGEILHHEFPTGALRHESWFHELDLELQAQIIRQLPDPEQLHKSSCLIAA